MPTAFITGGTGFIGGHLIRKVCQQGFHVKALVRKSTSQNISKSTSVDLIQGDLSNIAAIRSGMKDCDLVFHAAADYRLWTRNPKQMYAANVEGTKNVLQAALDLRIPKVIYTSTVGTIGLGKQGQPSDEKTFLKFDSHTGHYKRSKFLAEKEALNFARLGLPVVIVNPSAPVGSHDWKPTPTGRVVVDFLNRKMPMYLNTGLNLVDVEDVAEGHWLAAVHGRVGERYILGNQNLTLKQILDLLADITSIPAPTIRCPYFLALMAAWSSELTTLLLGGNEPRVPREGVYMARKYMFFDSSKAMRELKYQPGPVRIALMKAVLWFCENGYVKKSLPTPLDRSILGSNLDPNSLLANDENAIAMGK
jgi:dihydroflavonol-4-reductase